MKNLFVFFAVIFAFGVQAFAQVITTSFERGGYIVKEYSLKDGASFEGGGLVVKNSLVNPEMWKDSVLVSEDVLTNQSDEKKVYLEMLIYSQSLSWKISWTNDPKYSDLLPVYSNQIDYLLRLESCPLNTPKTKWGFSEIDLKKLIGDAFTDMTWAYYLLYTRNGETDVDRESVLYYANKALAYDSTNYQLWTYCSKLYYQAIDWENIYGLTLLLKDDNPARKEAREAGLSKAKVIVENAKIFLNALEKAEEYGMLQDEEWTKCLLEEGKNKWGMYWGLIEKLEEVVENKN